MLTDFTGADRIYIACGYTDLRRGIDGLASMVQQQFDLDPFTNTLFLFCGRRRDRNKHPGNDDHFLGGIRKVTGSGAAASDPECAYFSP